MVNEGEYNLTTKARRKVMGRNTQLDEGAVRQTWKCHDPLICVASVGFRKHCTWVQTWIGIFRGKPADSAELLTLVL